MSYASLLDCKADIRRMIQPVDEYGTPGAPVAQTIGIIPCAVSRQTITSMQGAPMVESGISYRLYFLRGADVREGDLAVVAGHGKFRLAAPYRPRGHHTEVDGKWEGEA